VCRIIDAGSDKKVFSGMQTRAALKAVHRAGRRDRASGFKLIMDSRTRLTSAVRDHCDRYLDAGGDIIN